MVKPILKAGLLLGESGNCVLAGVAILVSTSAVDVSMPAANTPLVFFVLEITVLVSSSPSFTCVAGGVAGGFAAVTGFFLTTFFSFGVNRVPPFLTKLLIMHVRGLDENLIH